MKRRTGLLLCALIAALMATAEWYGAALFNVILCLDLIINPDRKE